jgi:uncharacterized protein
MLAKPSGPDCNLACTYCFYLQKAALFADGRPRMSPQVLEAYVRQLFEAQRGREVHLAWQGGEPTLMGPDFFERAVELARRHARPGQRVSHSIQTNGVLLDERWCAFLKRHDFLVGVSIDGPDSAHDRFRVNRGGGATHAQVVRAFGLLRTHGVRANVLCTVNAANEGRPLDVYRHFRDDLKADYVQFIPVVERIAPAGGEAGSPRPVSVASVDPDRYGRFLVAVFEEWSRNDIGRVTVGNFEAVAAGLLGAPATVCVFAETCGGAPVIEHNGDVYSCDHYVDGSHRLGNILEVPLAEMMASARQAAFGAVKRDALPRQCRECRFLRLCRGECPKNRFGDGAGAAAGVNYLCAGYRHFFGHVERPVGRIVALFRAGRTAGEVMAALAGRA